MVLCATILGKCTCTLYEQKTPVLIRILRAYTGIGDAETQSPGMLRKPTRGFALRVARAQKGIKGLPRATHCTDRAQTSGNVTPTVELCPSPPTIGTKVRARRDVPEEGENDKYTYTYALERVTSHSSFLSYRSYWYAPTIATVG